MKRISGEKLKLEFGRRVRKYRIAMNWTLEETEEHGWPSWRHLQRIETGAKNVTLETIVRLGHLFSIDPGELLRGL
jgi:transcriptional regulator with XRE-family HTH domain